MEIGAKVCMSESCKQQLIVNDSDEHVAEFGHCIGIVESLVEWVDSIGPEVNVRWQPSNLRYMVVFDRNIKAVIHPTSYDNLIKDLYAMAEANELEKLFEPAEKIPLNFLLWLQTKVNFWKRG